MHKHTHAHTHTHTHTHTHIHTHTYTQTHTHTHHTHKHTGCSKPSIVVMRCDMGCGGNDFCPTCASSGTCAKCGAGAYPETDDDSDSSPLPTPALPTTVTPTITRRDTIGSISSSHAGQHQHTQHSLPCQICENRKQTAQILCKNDCVVFTCGSCAHKHKDKPCFLCGGKVAKVKEEDNDEYMSTARGMGCDVCSKLSRVLILQVTPSPIPPSCAFRTMRRRTGAQARRRTGTHAHTHTHTHTHTRTRTHIHRLTVQHVLCPPPSTQPTHPPSLTAVAISAEWV
jgi:hypothetical protein